MRRDYSTKIAQEIRGFLMAGGWNFHFDEDMGMFRFGVTLSGNLKNTQYVVAIEDESYSVYASSPISASKDNMREMMKMAEFVCRANFALRDGNFDFDFRDGELRYKCYVNCDGMIPTFGILRDSINLPAAMISRYGQGIVRMLFEDMTPEEAVEFCERRKTEPEEERSVDVSEEDTEEGEFSLSRDEKTDLIMKMFHKMRRSRGGDVFDEDDLINDQDSDSVIDCYDPDDDSDTDDEADFELI